tara:strand:+ start:404 stop:586 length:183 start_codon:yes stop_codon:yes gene_type:complete
MVAFARAKAKSIFSKLLFPDTSKSYMEINEENTDKGKAIQKEKNSNHFLEAIKNGGIWLS